MDKLLAADNPLMLRPGWVTLRMRVRPGAVPVTDIRVAGEAGGPGHAREWVPLVRQWVGCSTNKLEMNYQVTFTFGIQGHYQLPPKEGFGLYAFKSPQGSPALPSGDSGLGVCPVSATVRLNQPQAPNVVVNLEGQGGEAVTRWLTGLVPDRDYMTPDPKGNRVEFPCRVNNGVVMFYES